MNVHTFYEICKNHFQQFLLTMKVCQFSCIHRVILVQDAVDATFETNPPVDHFKGTKKGRVYLTSLVVSYIISIIISIKSLTYNITQPPRGSFRVLLGTPSPKQLRLLKSSINVVCFLRKGVLFQSNL